jgi:hypothetical protein
VAAAPLLAAALTLGRRHHPLAIAPQGCAATISSGPLSMAAARTGPPPPSTGRRRYSIVMSSDQETEALRQRLEALVKDADTTEAKAATTRHRVKAARQLLEEEKATANDLERTAVVTKGQLPSSSTPSTSADTSMDASYMSIITNLHLQATVVSNIRQLVSIVLDTTSSNYALWHDLKLMALT